jgi:hypothetical protein
MTMANLSISHFGPWVSPINAFVLIGLDLALRDYLHYRLKAWQMLALISATGLVTYLLNPAAAIAMRAAIAKATGGTSAPDNAGDKPPQVGLD